jgi:hypothetical protein
MSEWMKITEAVPRDTDILFMTGDECLHHGIVMGNEKIRKCIFRSYYYRENYDSDSNTDYDDRVIYWHPIPKLPEES